MNIRLIQNVLLVWLDKNIQADNADCRNTLTQLHQIVHTINTYTDTDECLQFLETMTNEKVCVIISDSLGQFVVPRLHSMTQVSTIFIFCRNKEKHEQWAKEWSKINGVFTKIAPICEELKNVSEQCEQDAIPISFMATNSDISQKKLDQFEPLFMYSQILKEILLSITFGEEHFRQYIQYYHKALADNNKEVKITKELNIANELEAHYYDKTPIWWYTYPCFLYTLLNRALRLMDVDIIIHMGFFVSDLHRHIEKLHQQQFPAQDPTGTFTVYRGQGLSTTQFKELSDTKSGLLSFNNFLSTSKNRKISLKFANTAMKNAEMVGVLFVMTIEPEQIHHSIRFNHQDELL